MRYLSDDFFDELLGDAYGAAIKVMKDAIHNALMHSGQMNSTEFENLVAIEEFIRFRDNA